MALHIVLSAQQKTRAAQRSFLKGFRCFDDCSTSIYDMILLSFSGPGLSLLSLLCHSRRHAAAARTSQEWKEEKKCNQLKSLEISPTQTRVRSQISFFSIFFSFFFAVFFSTLSQISNSLIPLSLSTARRLFLWKHNFFLSLFFCCTGTHKARDEHHELINFIFISLTNARRGWKWWQPREEGEECGHAVDIGNSMTFARNTEDTSNGCCFDSSPNIILAAWIEVYFILSRPMLQPFSCCFEKKSISCYLSSVAGCWLTLGHLSGPTLCQPSEQLSSLVLVRS